MPGVGDSARPEEKSEFGRSRGNWRLPILTLLGLTLVFLSGLVSLDRIAIGNVEDHLRLLYPYRALDAEYLRAWSLPLWNPYTFSGFPYFASMNCHIFYPVNLIFLILPTHLGMNFSLILHVLLAGVFMFALATELGRRPGSALASALAFMFSGFFIDELWWGHETVLGSITWTPLVFFFYLKAVKSRKIGYAVLGGLVFGIQLFAGHPQFAFYGLMALAFFSVVLFMASLRTGGLKKALPAIGAFFIIALIGFALFAVQLIPAAELSAYSVRAPGQEDVAFFTRWSMEPSYLLTFVLPRLAPIIGTNSFPFPVSLGYVGIVALAMAILSLGFIRNRNVLFFWMLAFISLVLAAGRYTPLYGLLSRFLPGFRAFRNPIFFIYMYVFSISVLVGFGVSFLKSKIWALREHTLKRAAGAMMALAALSILAASLVFSLTSGVPPKNGSGMAAPAAGFKAKIQKYRDPLVHDVGTAGVVVLAAVFPLAFRKKIRSRDRILQTVVVLLIFFEMRLYGARFLRTYDLTPFISKGSWVDFLKKESQPFRVLPILDYPEQDPVLKLNKISSVNGYGSLEILKDYADFLAAFQDQPVIQELTLMRVARYDSVAVNLLNTKYILTSKTIDDDRFRLVYTDRIPAAKTWDPERRDTLPLYVYENTAALPRAFLVHSVKVIKDKERILGFLKNPGFRPREVLVLEESPEYAPESLGPGEEEQISFERVKDGEIIIKASSAKKGFLFLSEIQYPGWKAFVDGKEARIYTSNYMFRSVFLERGVHTVRFIFKPSSFRRGAAISLVTLLGLLGFFGIQAGGTLRRFGRGERRSSRPEEPD